MTRLTKVRSVSPHPQRESRRIADVPPLRACIQLLEYSVPLPARWPEVAFREVALEGFAWPNRWAFQSSSECSVRWSSRRRTALLSAAQSRPSATLQPVFSSALSVFSLGSLALPPLPPHLPRKLRSLYYLSPLLLFSALSLASPRRMGGGLARWPAPGFPLEEHRHQSMRVLRGERRRRRPLQSGHLRGAQSTPKPPRTALLSATASRPSVMCSRFSVAFLRFFPWFSPRFLRFLRFSAVNGPSGELARRRPLHQHGERRFGALHRAVQRVALHRLAAGFADQSQQFAAAQALAVVAPASW